MKEFWFILSVIFFISGFCLGWRIITSPGMIFGFLREGALKYLPVWIAKPIILCITCLSSFWGSIIFWVFLLHTHNHISLFTIFEWILSCITSAFVSTFIWKLMDLIDKKTNQ